MTIKPKRKIWKFVFDNTGKVILLIVGFWFLCGVGYGAAHINPSIPGNFMIGCLLIGFFSVAVPGLVTIKLVLEWVSWKRRKQLIARIQDADAYFLRNVTTLENPEEK